MSLPLLDYRSTAMTENLYSSFKYLFLIANAGKFGFEHLIFLIFLRFGADFCNFLDFSFRSFFELGIFKNDAWASQNDS